MSKSDEKTDRLAGVLGDTLAHAANEALVLARLEEFLDPKPPKLATSKEHANALNKSVEALVKEYGGPARLIIHFTNEPKPRYDT